MPCFSCDINNKTTTTVIIIVTTATTTTNTLFFLCLGFLDRFHVRVHRQAGLQVRARLGHEGLRQLHPGRLSARGMGRPKQIRVQVTHLRHIIAFVTHSLRHTLRPLRVSSH